MNKSIIADIPVTFGGVSIGKSTAKLSLKVNRLNMSIEHAEELFCERRLSGVLQMGGADDGSGQMKFFDTDPKLEGSFDVHRFGVTADVFSTGITFKTKEIEANLLAKFANGSGRLIAFEAGPIPEEIEPEDRVEDNGQQSIPGTFETNKPWREASLDGLFTGALLKALKAEGIATVGDLHDYQQPAKSGFEKRLGDIKGIGPSKVQLIEDRMVEFWRDNPQAEGQVLEGK